MHSNRQQRLAALEAAKQWQAEEREAAQLRLLTMAETGQPTPPAPGRPVSTKASMS